MKNFYKGLKINFRFLRTPILYLTKFYFPIGAAFSNGHTRKIFFCNEKFQNWQPGIQKISCPVKSGHVTQNTADRPCSAGTELMKGFKRYQDLI